MKRVFPIFAVLTALLLGYAFYEAMWVAPKERTLGDVQRIFYYHVPSAWTAFLLFFVNLVTSVIYLARRNIKADAVAVVSAEVGVVFCTVVLVTGPIWARPVWGIWWTWDARLTTTFILWLLYIAYLLLRGLLEEPERKATLSAIFGIFAFLDVPLVYMSNRLWRTQHPQPVIFGGENSGLAPTMKLVLLLCVIAGFGVMVLILVDRYRLERLRYEFAELRHEVESRASDALFMREKGRS